MDVILDSNVFLEDLVFERAQFGELFAYLRRTNSRIVVPTVVRDEVEARFRERLSKQINIAKSAWEQVTKLTGDSNRSLPYVDAEGAMKSLRNRLQNPSHGVLESLFLQLDSVDLNEVVQRGIHRRKPASAEGEELRDVIIWLIVKSYAKEKSNEVAFISKDAGFRIAKESHELHPDLRAELNAGGLSVSYHTDIAGFITTHALTERPIAEPWLSQFLRITDLRRIATGLLLAKGSAYGIVLHAEIDSLDFAKGTEYEIASNSSYVEAIYDGTATLRITPNLFSVTLGGDPVFSYNAISPSPNLGTEYSLDLSQSSYANVPIHAETFVANYPSVITPQVATPENRKCIFTLAFSGRVENGKVVSGEIDDLQITYMSSLIRSD